ncbi:MAG: hypothetical protein HYZ22_02210 [Chloroflexi bacterium]|nr:hypothetical protein [Chloroflexota bacterium]
MSEKLLYRVSTFRNAGLTARWDKTYRGQPYIKVCLPSSDEPNERAWWVVDQKFFDHMKDLGVMEGFKSAVLLGHIFAIPVY